MIFSLGGNPKCYNQNMIFTPATNMKRNKLRLRKSQADVRNERYEKLFKQREEYLELKKRQIQNKEDRNKQRDAFLKMKELELKLKLEEHKFKYPNTQLQIDD